MLRLAAKGPPQPVTLAFAGIGAALLVAARVLPFDRIPLLHCPLRTGVGIPCPSCGMTRAFRFFVRGELGAAVEVSPLGTLLAALAVALALYGLLRLTVLRRGLALSLGPTAARATRIGIASAIAGNWLYLLVTRAAG
jgi:hypothetical protein